MYNQDATTDINAKYDKRRGSAQGCAFWGLQNQNLTFTPPFSQKPPFRGPKNSFNIRGAKSKRPLNVIVAP